MSNKCRFGGFEMLVKKYQNKAINIAYSLTANRANAEEHP